MVLTHYLGSLRFIVVGYLCVDNVVCLGFQITVPCILFGDREVKPGFSVLLHCLGCLLRKNMYHKNNGPVCRVSWHPKVNVLEVSITAQVFT